MVEDAHNVPGRGGTIGSVGTAVKEGVVGSLKGLNEVETEIVNLVRSTVSQTLKATGEVAMDSVAVIRDVVTGALQATEEVGIGLIVSTKSVTKGVVLGVRDVGGDVLSVAHQAVKLTFRTLFSRSMMVFEACSLAKRSMVLSHPTRA